MFLSAKANIKGIPLSKGYYDTILIKRKRSGLTFFKKKCLAPLPLIVIVLEKNSFFKSRKVLPL